MILSVSILTCLAIFASLTAIATEDAKLDSALTVIDQFKSPGLEAELSGVYPHPADPDLYLVLANLKPPYRYGQKPMLPAQYRGGLLTVNRNGEVIKSVKLADDDFGGLALAEGYLYAALTDAAEVIKIDPDSGKIMAHISLPSPAGGLGYDKDRGALIAQLYVGHPHLAVVDLESGAVTETLWSDESAMGLAKVDGDWLCTWASGWDPGSFSELRVLDQNTGKVRSRIKLSGVHSSLAPATDANGGAAFLSLVTVDSESGETVIRKYSYAGEAKAAQL
jgi:hypothetical protein